MLNVTLITRMSLVRVQPPLPNSQLKRLPDQSGGLFYVCGWNLTLTRRSFKLGTGPTSKIPGLAGMTTIFVADDDRDIGELVVDTLFDKGYDILESKDGREVVDIAIKEVPDLSLLDVTMPFLDGFVVVKKLKENILTESIPVVMPTAMGALDSEQNALDLAVKHYVSKSFDSVLLLATMQVALREAEAKVDYGDDFGKVWGESILFRSVSDSSGLPTIIPIASQLSALDKKLNGGFRLETCA